MAFINYAKEFNEVSWQKMWEIFHATQFPNHLKYVEKYHCVKKVTADVISESEKEAPCCP
jgi:hypothetical protein